MLLNFIAGVIVVGTGIRAGVKYIKTKRENKALKDYIAKQENNVVVVQGHVITNGNKM